MVNRKQGKRTKQNKKTYKKRHTLKKVRKNRTQKFRKTKYYKRGAGLVAQGAYGCVYRPPLPCKDASIDITGRVTKMMLKSEAKKELREYEHINEIDPKFEFHLEAPYRCSIGTNTFTGLSDKELKECDVYKKIVQMYQTYNYYS